MTENTSFTLSYNFGFIAPTSAPLASEVVQERRNHPETKYNDLMDLMLEGKDPQTGEKLPIDCVGKNVCHPNNHHLLQTKRNVIACYPRHCRSRNHCAFAVLYFPNFPLCKPLIRSAEWHALFYHLLCSQAPSRVCSPSERSRLCTSRRTNTRRASQQVAIRCRCASECAPPCA